MVVQQILNTSDTSLRTYCARVVLEYVLHREKRRKERNGMECASTPLQETERQVFKANYEALSKTFRQKHREDRTP